MSSRLDGISATQALFAALSNEARTELKEELVGIADEVLALQQKFVPVYSGKPRKRVIAGKLKAALTIEQAIAELRVKIGYPRLGRGKSSLFYALIMEKGRKGGTVTAQRLGKAGRSEWLSRIRDGRARASRKPSGLGSTYQLRVTPLAPRVHVHIENQVADLINTRLADFWGRVLSRTA